MADGSWDLGWLPEYGAARAREPRMLNAKYGDGYEQSVSDGINNNPATWTLRFKYSAVTADLIDQFLILWGPAQGFWWQDPHGAVIRVKCKKWTSSIDDWGNTVVSCSFEQIFDRPGVETAIVAGHIVVIG